MAVLDRVAGDIEGLLATIREQTSDPVQRLKNLIRLFFSIVKEKREYYCVNMDFWTQINQKENVRRAVARHYVKLRAATTTLVQQGIDSGVFKPGNASHYASIIISIVDGISLQWLFEETVFEYDEITKNCEDVVLNSLLINP